MKKFVTKAGFLFLFVNIVGYLCLPYLHRYIYTSYGVFPLHNQFQIFWIGFWSIVCFVVMYSFWTVLLPRISLTMFQNDSDSLLRIDLLVYIISIWIVIFNFGLFRVLLSSDYGDRTELSKGLGIILNFFLPLSTISLTERISKRRLKKQKYLFIFLIANSIILLLTTGARSMSFLWVAQLLVFLMVYDKVQPWKIMFAGIILFLIMTTVIVFRYGFSGGGASFSLIYSVGAGLLGSFDLTTFDRVLLEDVSWVGFDSILDMVTRYIPRAIYPEKPVFFGVASEVVSILFQGSNVSRTPTWLGAGYIYSGYWGILISVFCFSFFFSVIDKINLNNGKTKIFNGFVLLTSFGYFRDGIEAIITTLVFFVFLYFYRCFTAGFTLFVKKIVP